MTRRQALGLGLLFCLVVVGRGIRSQLLIAPSGSWRDPLLFADFLVDDPAPTAAASRPVLTGTLRINCCREDSLVLLPGVGPVLAERIAAARRAGVSFRRPEDLEQIKGIGPRLAQKLAPWLDFAVSDVPPTAFSETIRER